MYSLSSRIPNQSHCDYQLHKVLMPESYNYLMKPTTSITMVNLTNNLQDLFAL